jgi:hypothetical protein
MSMITQHTASTGAPRSRATVRGLLRSVAGTIRS